MAFLLDNFPNDENWQLADCYRYINCKYHGPRAEFQMGVWRHLSFLYIALDICTDKQL